MHRGPRWKIAVYGRKHGVPHFHIEGPDFRASVSIGSLETIVGSVPPAVLREAIGWASSNRRALIRMWQELNG